MERLEKAVQIKMMIKNAGKVNECLQFPFKRGAMVGQGIDSRGNLYAIPLQKPFLDKMAKVIYSQGNESLQLRFTASSDSLEKQLDFFAGLDRFSYIFTAHGHLKFQKQQLKSQKSSTAHLLHYKDHFSEKLDYQFKTQDKQIRFRKQVIQLLQSIKPVQKQKICKQFFQLYGTHIIVQIDYAFSFYGKIECKQNHTNKNSSFNHKVGSGPSQGQDSQQRKIKNQQTLKDLIGNLFGKAINIAGIPEAKIKFELNKKKVNISDNYNFSFNCKTAGVTIPILRGITQKDLSSAYIIYLNQVHLKTKNQYLFSKQTITQIQVAYLKRLIQGTSLDQQFQKKKLKIGLGQKVMKQDQNQPTTHQISNSRTTQQYQFKQFIQKDNAEPYLIIALPWSYFLDELKVGQSSEDQSNQISDNIRQLISFSDTLDRLSALQTNQVKVQVYQLIRKSMNLSDYEMAAQIIVMAIDMDDFTHQITDHYQKRKEYSRLTNLYQALDKLDDGRAKSFAMENLYAFRKLNFCQKIIRTIFCCCYQQQAQRYQTCLFSKTTKDKTNQIAQVQQLKEMSVNTQYKRGQTQRNISRNSQ